MSPTPTTVSYEEGMLVQHPARPQWGPGKVLAVVGSKVTVYFRDLVEAEPGAVTKTIDTRVVALDVADAQSDPQLDNLPQFKNGKFATSLPRLTMEEAIQMFLRQCPGGFKDPAYIGDLQDGERAYKLHAHELFKETLGEGRGAALLEEDRIGELTRLALEVDGKVNLLSRYEKMALRGALIDEDAARRYFVALFGVIDDNGPQEESFTAYIRAVESLPAAEGRARVATWPVLTLLPFLAQPRLHMLLKPGKTNDCAARLRYDIQYKPGLNWITYKKLIQMADLMLGRLRQHGAEDYIDIQSFMWLIGSLKR